MESLIEKSEQASQPLQCKTEVDTIGQSHKALQIQFHTKPLDYYQGNHETPILEKCSRPYSHCLAMNIILDKAVCSTYPTCSKIPKACTSNCVFLMDLTKLKSPKDLLADDNGKWRWGGQAKTQYMVEESDARIGH